MNGRHDACMDFVGEDVGLPTVWEFSIDRLNGIEPATHDNDFRIKHVDHHRGRSGKSVEPAIEQITCFWPRGQLGGRQRFAPESLPLTFDRGTRQPGLQAPRSPAPAARSRQLVVPRPRKRNMAPFASHAVVAGHQRTANNHSAADASSEDDGKDARGVGRCTIGGLAEGQAVGVIGESNGPADDAGQISAKWMTIEHR